MSRDTNFYYSFLVLPREKRDAIVAVWDFCRAVDDAADEAASSALRGGRCEELAARIGRVLRGRAAGQPARHLRLRRW